MEHKIIEILENLIEIPSYVAEDTNESILGKYIFDFLKSNTTLVVEKQRVDNNRFNVIAYANLKPEVVFFSHMDTVPPKKETKYPFVARKVGRKLYGLGSVDMKAGLAISLTLATKLCGSQKIAYVFTVDEEYEFKGALKLIKEYNFRPKIVVNLEPTSLKMLNGCRGVTEFSFEVHGKSCHAGTKYLGVNAIEKTAEIFKDLQSEISKFDNESGSNSLNLAYLNGGNLINDGLVGYGGNVVPNYAFCVGEIRLASKEIAEKWIEKEIKRIGKQVGVVCDNFKFKFLMKSAYTPKNKLKKFEEAVEANNLKPEYKDINSTGYFEVQLLQEAWNTDLIVFGPGPSNMAYQADEYVEIDTVLKAQKVIESYLKITGVN